MKSALLLFLLSSFSFAQNLPLPSAPQPDTCGVKHLDRCIGDLAKDQAGIWTSPLHSTRSELRWEVPLALASGAAFYFDGQAQQQLGYDKQRVDTSNQVSNIGSPFSTISAGLGMYALGGLTHNDHLSETGRLSTEAILDAGIVAQALKFATNRERPSAGDGELWPGRYSTSSSFPSGHAITVWAFARVVSSEYPGALVKIGAYGLATAVSVARVTGRNHFPSDVLVGSSFGYLIGGYVYRHHSAEEADNSLMIAPSYDARTHEAGISVMVPPSALAHPLKTLNALRP